MDKSFILYLYGAIKLFLTGASLERDDAVDAKLPIEDVVDREVDQRQFASREFYYVAIKLECVFYHILGEKSIEIFGPQIIADMEACLNRVDIGIASLLTGWEDIDDVNNLKERVIEAFCNMRGKDYDKAKKKKAEEENVTVVFDNEIDVDAMLCAELRAELKKRKLFVTGKKAELKTRLKNGIANRKRAEQEQG
eukprot:scaffold9590_cov188-Skeletonema_marinoi.AAC.1